MLMNRTNVTFTTRYAGAHPIQFMLNLYTYIQNKYKFSCDLQMVVESTGLLTFNAVATD
jgi:hypothetical protein